MKTLAMAIAIAALSATSTIAQFNPFFPSYNDRFLWSTTGVDVRCGSPYTHHCGQRWGWSQWATPRRAGRFMQWPQTNAQYCPKIAKPNRASAHLRVIPRLSARYQILRRRIP